MQPDTPLVDVFDDLDQAMLILGAPGSGKTTTMLNLLGELLARARADINGYIPVFLPLASWALRREPLEKWLLREVSERYRVPARHVRAWLEDDQLGLLLDGLDEVAAEYREQCVKFINDYRSQHGTVPIGICCRTLEYQKFQVPLTLYGTIMIQSLSRSQVAQFLNRPDGSFSRAKAVLAQEPGLWDLVDTPLMLSVLVLAFRAPTSPGSVGGENRQELLNRLFVNYVQTMLRHRNAEEPPQSTVRKLAFLARQLERFEQTDFTSDLLDESSLPDRWWSIALALATWFLEKAILVLGMGSAAMAFFGWPGAILGAVAGTLASFNSGLRISSYGLALQAKRTEREAQRESPAEIESDDELIRGASELMRGVLSEEELLRLVELVRAEMPEAGPLGAVSDEYIQQVLREVLSGKLSEEKLGELMSRIVPEKELRARIERYERDDEAEYQSSLTNEFDDQILKLMQIRNPSLRVRLAQYGATAFRQVPVTADWWLNFRERLEDRHYYLGDLSAAGVIIALLIAMVAGILLGWPYAAAAMLTGLITLVAMTVIDKLMFRITRWNLAREFPSPGLRAALRVGIPAAAAVGSLTGTIGGLLVGWLSDARDGWHFGLAAAISVALFSLSCLGGSAFLEQVKIRLTLHWADLLPIRSQPFLDHAAQRLFLQHSGESYQFVHRSLQEFFAGLCLYRTVSSHYSEPDGYLIDLLMPTGLRPSSPKATARFRLSALVEYHPVPSALPVARACYTQAAEADDADAQFRLGLLLEDQLDPPDLAAARTWYTRAAKQGHTDAQYSLALLLVNRLDPPDLREARTWLTKAAEADDADAQFALGALLAAMQQPPDLAAARTWYTRAAKQGHAHAQYNLALLLARLNPAHLRRSRAWLTRAAKAGNVQAQELLRDLWGIEVTARHSGSSD